MHPAAKRLAHASLRGIRNHDHGAHDDGKYAEVTEFDGNIGDGRGQKEQTQIAETAAQKRGRNPVSQSPAWFTPDSHRITVKSRGDIAGSAGMFSSMAEISPPVMPPT